jgi:hypothetical protein
MGFDKVSKPFGDPVTVGGDDRGMRDRQSKRPPEKDDDRVPIGEAADRRGFRESRQKTEAPIATLQELCRDEERETSRQDERGEKLHSLEFAQPGQILATEDCRRLRPSFFE